MKTANSALIKHIVASALAITSLIAPFAARSTPLTISAFTQEHVGFRPDCASQFGGTTTGIGISSVLGHVSLEAQDCITPMETYFSFTGNMTFTVSRGDELFADYSGSFIPTSYPSIFTLTNSIFSITGGTGRFQSATGEGILKGSQNIENGWGFMQATGSIFNFYNNNKGKSDKNESHRGKPGPSFVDIDASTIADDTPATRRSSDEIGVVSLDQSMLPDSLTLGDHFYQDQNGQLLAINGLPESGSLSLLGIGLVCLAAIRRRKLPKLQINH